MANVLASFAFGRPTSPPGAKEALTTLNQRLNSPPVEALPGSWILADEEMIKGKLDGPVEVDLQDMNTCLQLLSELFPDVQAEVFREMVSNLSKQSRVEVVTEHLLKDKGKWVKGRYKPAAAAGPKAQKSVKGSQQTQTVVPRQETFRSTAYRTAVKDALYKEFKGLSHASIKAVLAEHNYSYTAARPVLQQLSTKSWRFYLTNLWSRRAKDGDNPYIHPLVNWQIPFGEDGVRIPYLRNTPSHELNEELYETYIAPVVKSLNEDRLEADHNLATQLNEKEATEVGALFGCECCYDSVPWENIAACDSGAHTVCTLCIRATMKEAVFGQGWTKTVDMERGTLRCLASGGDVGCCVLPPDQVQRAVLTGDDGEKMWHNFEDQLTRRSLETCGLALQRCPFCPYAEVKKQQITNVKDLLTLTRHIAKLLGFAMFGQMNELAFWLLVQPLLIIYALLWIALQLIQLTYPAAFTASQERIMQRRNGLKFQCCSARCALPSCSVCLAKWTDPHICYETTTNSLRHAVEAATTAVVKRTCPRCNTSFVKSTGCNKLVCPCGYNMCYICRSAIGSEGYAHFCQHFREQRGRCKECDRCDLYAVEDEAAAIKQAALEAEKNWRRREGLVKAESGGSKTRRRRTRGADRFDHITEEVLWGSKGARRWTWEDALDGFLEVMLA